MPKESKMTAIKKTPDIGGEKQPSKSEESGSAINLTEELEREHPNAKLIVKLDDLVTKVQDGSFKPSTTAMALAVSIQDFEEPAEVPDYIPAMLKLYRESGDVATQDIEKAISELDILLRDREDRLIAQVVTKQSLMIQQIQDTAEIEKPRSHKHREVASRHKASMGGGGDFIPTIDVPEPLQRSYSSTFNLNDPNIAFVDSAANKHLLRSMKRLQHIRDARIMMHSSNGESTEISKVGDLHLRTKDSDGTELDPLILREASVLLGAPLNLISVGLLTEKGSTFHFEKGNSYFTHHGKKFKMLERDGLFAIRLDQVLEAEEFDNLRHLGKHGEDTVDLDGQCYGCAATYDLWHERFGHANKRRIKFLYDNGSVEGLDVNGKFKHDKKCKCPACVQTNSEKMHIGNVRKFVDDVTQIGQQVVCDLCGPFPESVEGYRYVISFTDVYSRFSACYFLRRKSDAEHALESFVAFFKKEGFVVKCIRSDQGGEFGSHHERPSDEGSTTRKTTIPVFSRVCALHDIKHELTPAYRPELHGLAERWNKTVIRMANAMLFSARLSHVLWPQAVAHANMLRNRLPLRGLGQYTPYTIFYKKRPRVDQLRVFGCDCYKLLPRYPKIPGQLSRKRLIFVGFTPDRMGWRCFDPIDFKFTTEWELIFDEHSAEKRKNSLREYDERRKLQSEGNLAELPTVINELESYENGTYDLERKLFDSPINAPTIENTGCKGEDGEVRSVDKVGDALDKSAPASVEEEVETQAAEDDCIELSASGGLQDQVDAGATSNTSKQRKREEDPACTITASDEIIENTEIKDTRSSRQSHKSVKDIHQSENCRTKLKTNAEVEVEVEKAVEPDVARRMGGGVKSKSKSAWPHSSSPTTQASSKDGSGFTTEGARIDGPWERPTRLSTTQSIAKAGSEVKSQNTKVRKSDAVRRMKELQHAEDLIVNNDADKYGPLTAKAMAAARESFKFDPTNPIRPARIEPPGVFVPDTEAFKQFRQAAMENDYMIKLVDNPKQEGKDSWKRYQKYQQASTLREIIELSVTSQDPKIRKWQRSTALKDIAYDSRMGFILFPQHENNSPTHFVNALSVARINSTVCIHSLYSTEELGAARDKRTKRLKKKIAKREAELQSGGHSVALLTFQEQMLALWEHDEVLERLEACYQHESALGAVAIAKMLAGAEDIPDPVTYKQATSQTHPEKEEWKSSMGRERSTLQSRGTWVLVKRKSIGGHKPVKCKYVYKKKRNKDGSIQFKSRLVGCGYSQIRGVDFNSDEVYAGVCSYSSMRFLMSYACGKGMVLSQSDITGAYLIADLKETVYMEPPPDMFVDGMPPVDEDGDEVVCLLKKGLYGLVQSGHAWSECFKEFMLKDEQYNMGFKEFTGESNLYRKTFTLNGKKEEVVVGIYVDDCLIASSSEEARQWFMEKLGSRFPVNQKSSGLITEKDPGLVLSMNVRYNIKEGVLQFDQRQSIELLAKKLGIIDKSPRSLPISPHCKLPKLQVAEVNQKDYLSIIGSVLHLSQVSRPDIAYAVGVLSRHSATPGQEHMQVALDLVNYLYNTRFLSIQYRKTNAGEVKIFEKASKPKKQRSIEERLKSSVPVETANEADMYTDADYGGDKNNRRSTSGMIIMMNGGPISWSSRLQKLCALSTAEAEIYAVTDSVKEAIHIKLLCEECGIREPGRPITIWEDNNACIQMGHGLRGSKAAKHYEVRLRFLNEHVRDKTIEFARIRTEKQLADAFTKPLAAPAFKNFRGKVLV